MGFAYSKALAFESLNSHRLAEKYDEQRKTYHHVTAADFEHFARIVAYKVAHHLKNGSTMDPKGDPLTYVDCEDYPCLVPEGTKPVEGSTMKLNEEQIEELKKAALPLMMWLSDNCHPHCKAILDNTHIEIVESLASVLYNNENPEG